MTGFFVPVTGQPLLYWWSLDLEPPPSKRQHTVGRERSLHVGRSGSGHLVVVVVVARWHCVIRGAQVRGDGFRPSLSLRVSVSVVIDKVSVRAKDVSECVPCECEGL